MDLFLSVIGVVSFRRWPTAIDATDMTLSVLLGLFGLLLAPVLALLLLRMPVLLLLVSLLLGYASAQFPHLGVGLGAACVLFSCVWLLDGNFATRHGHLASRPQRPKPEADRIRPADRSIGILALTGVAAALFFLVVAGLFCAASLMLATSGFWLWKSFEPPPRMGFACVYGLRGWLRVLLSYAGVLAFVMGTLGFLISLALLK